MKINNRLKAIAMMVEDDAKVMDIGCDHALLDIYLVEEKNIPKCVASDIAEGPIEAAKKNIKLHHLEDKIETKLGNGLDVYSSDLDTVIISGLGGKTMQGVFYRNLKKLKTINTIILSPNNYQADIKKYLCHKGYYIEEEQMIKEHRIIYQIIKFKKGKKRYTKKEFFFGPILLQNKDSLFKEFYSRELKSREILLALLPKNYRYKRFKTKKEIKLLNEELKDSNKK